MNLYTEIQGLLSKHGGKNLVSKILKEFEFGKVLFGDDFATFQNKVKEPDTKAEYTALSDIKHFVGSSDTSQKKRIQKIAPFLKSIKNNAPKILKQPSGWVFRGTSVQIKQLLKMFKTKKNFIDSFIVHNIEGKNIYKYKKIINYKPKFPVTSWSKKVKVAMRFEGNGGLGAMYATKTNDNFLFNPGFMNKISREKVSDTEFETISINETHKCLFFLSRANYDYILEEFDRLERKTKAKWWNQGF